MLEDYIENNIWMCGNMKFISSVDQDSLTSEIEPVQNEKYISYFLVHPCIVLFII